MRSACCIRRSRGCSDPCGRLTKSRPPARQHLNSPMEELARRGRPFSVLLAVVKNLEGLLNCHSPKVLESGLNTFKVRLENKLPGSATVGRWNKDRSEERRVGKEC